MYSVLIICWQCLGGNSADQNEPNPIVLGPTLLTQHNRRRNTYITTIKHKQTDRLIFIYNSLTPSSSLPFEKEKISSFKIITDRRTKLILISPSPQAPPSLYYILSPLEEGKNFSKIFPFFKRDHTHTHCMVHAPCTALPWEYNKMSAIQSASSIIPNNQSATRAHFHNIRLL